VAYPLENALFNWEAGIDRLRSLERSGELRGDDVTVPVREELRRRLGATFTAADLADLYGQGTDWALMLPGVDPGLADVQELIDAAFWLQLQAASDFAGGRVVLDLEVES
jgi:hypothetical protein